LDDEGAAEFTLVGCEFLERYRASDASKGIAAGGVFEIVRDETEFNEALGTVTSASESCEMANL
jgi:hypothetical protein